MKKLLKSEVYGFCKQCTHALFMREKSTTAAKKRKKRKKETRIVKRRRAITWIQTGTQGYLLYHYTEWQVLFVSDKDNLLYCWAILFYGQFSFHIFHFPINDYRTYFWEKYRLRHVPC